MTPDAPTQLLQLVECPRDAMQGWKRLIGTDEKIAYLNKLLQVGFHTLDFGSFVSPKAIPQMADTKEVLAGLDLAASRTRLLAIVANVRGAEEAALHAAIRYLGFPFSLSPTFQQRNTNSSMEAALERIAHIQQICHSSGKELVVYLSMGFGNPYGDAYDEAVLLHWAGELARRGIRILPLADTVGVATPAQIRFALETLIPQHPTVCFGVHLHAAPGNWQAKLEAAYGAGCRRFDGALNGIGGCPMATDQLVGNMNTERMIGWFRTQGVLPPLNEVALEQSLALAAALFGS